jgi:hypothetical protein
MLKLIHGVFFPLHQVVDRLRDDSTLATGFLGGTLSAAVTDLHAWTAGRPREFFLGPVSILNSPVRLPYKRRVLVGPG